MLCDGIRHRRLLPARSVPAGHRCIGIRTEDLVHEHATSSREDLEQKQIARHPDDAARSGKTPWNASRAVRMYRLGWNNLALHWIPRLSPRPTCKAICISRIEWRNQKNPPQRFFRAKG